MERNNRINITPLARQIKERGVNSVPFPTKEGEFFDLYSSVKPELYALSAIFVDRIVRRAYEARNNWLPFGLMTHVDGENSLGEYRAVTYKDLRGESPFGRLAMYMNDTLALGIDQEIREVTSGQSSPQMESIYRRLEKLVAFVGEIAERQNQEDYWFVQLRYKSVCSFINAGSGFAARVMSSIVGVIPSVAGNLDNPQRLVRIAKNSYPLVAKLSMLNAQKLGYVERLISGRPLPVDPKHITIEGSGDTVRLEISNTFIKESLKPGFTLGDLKIGRSPTSGCPAMVNFGDGSAIKMLWDWHIDIAEKIYPFLDAKS